MQKLITTTELAEYLSYKVSAIEAMRRRGDGPRFIKTGRYVRYREGDIQDWLNERSRMSTTVDFQ